MIILDTIYFLLRYTPWWSIPIIFICVQFAYIYWLKDIILITRLFVAIGGICGLILLYYIWAGSPDAAAGYLDNFLRKIN